MGWVRVGGAQATPPAAVVATTAATVPASRQRLSVSFWYDAMLQCLPVLRAR